MIEVCAAEIEERLRETLEKIMPDIIRAAIYCDANPMYMAHGVGVALGLTIPERVIFERMAHGYLAARKAELPFDIQS